MIKLIDQHVSKIAIAVLVSGISLAHPVYAADAPAAAPAATVPAAAPAAAPAMKHESSEDRVANRIKDLHDKLQITKEQEPKFEAVASVMKANEAAIHALAEKRHASEGASAVDDLKSYKEIADAHVAGLEKLIPAFQDLYGSLSDMQKKNADMLFGAFEGHGGHKADKADAPK